MLTTVTFDFWSTLYQSAPFDRQRTINRLQLDLELASQRELHFARLDEAVNVAWQVWQDRWQNHYHTLTAAEWLVAVLTALDLSLPPHAQAELSLKLANRLLDDPPTLVPDAKAALPHLAQHYRLAIISDTGMAPGSVLRQILANDGILHYFTQLTFSDEVQVSKPHPRAFELTLEALQATPSQAVHIGDLLRTDIAGALGVGMRAVQYIALNHDSGHDVQPTAVIESHTELLPLLETWSAG
jgi:putative hydrolase of the HAD superfamily